MCLLLQLADSVVHIASCSSPSLYHVCLLVILELQNPCRLMACRVSQTLRHRGRLLDHLGAGEDGNKHGRNLGSSAIAQERSGLGEMDRGGPWRKRCIGGRVSRPMMRRPDARL